MLPGPIRQCQLLASPQMIGRPNLVGDFLRIAVSGTRGFVGSQVARHLSARGHQVIPIHRLVAHGAAACDTLPSDCIDVGSSDVDLQECFDRVAPDAIVLVGAASSSGDGISDARDLVEGNVLLPSRLLAACRGARTRHALLLGTFWQEQRGTGQGPRNLYAATKQALVPIATHYAETGMQITQLQLFDTYGPGDPRPKVYNLMLQAAIQGLSLDLSPGQQKIHLVHVNDVCRAIELALVAVPQESGFSTYCVDSQALISVQELAEEVRLLVPSFRFRLGARRYRSSEVMHPMCLHGRLPGWTPTIPLDQGLRMCLDALST